jgi:non-lysosomal glucosylceramidase
MGVVYEGIRKREISFPLGGIGTGCVGLAGNGRFVDWEIFNCPGKGTTNGFSHFAVKAESGGRLLDARILQGDLPAPHTGQYRAGAFSGYGFGPDRETMAGLPHFREVRFEAAFPFAMLCFSGERFPGDVTLEAFNPFIPSNDFDSSLPVAMFEIGFRNPMDVPVRYSACFSLGNPLPRGRTVNAVRFGDGRTSLHLNGSGMDPDTGGYGDVSLATDTALASYQEYWYRGAWFDNLGIHWRDFTTVGPLRNRYYPGPDAADVGQAPAQADMGSLCGSIDLPPGGVGRIRFAMSWNFPNHVNTWNPPKQAEGDCAAEDACCGNGLGDVKKDQWKNYYALQFEDSSASMRYAFTHWDRLVRESRLFSDVLHRSTLPPEVLDAVAANLAILKSPTCLRLDDGSFYGFEGCLCNEGCCDGSCTHVWNYACALPFLFPSLERSMRDLDFRYNQDADGGMAFRLQLPPGRARLDFRPCADGQFGGVVKAYRDWKICGDDDWLREKWPAIRRSLDFAWHPGNKDRWDPEQTGVLTGRQHHTLDMELFGPNSWLTGMYLAALKAGAEMAGKMGEADCAAEYRRIFEIGKKWVDENLFNGEYYHQKIDIRDKGLLKPFEGTDAGVHAAYWNEEAGELKYQIGDGCAIDQVLGQWHANLCGLGEVLDSTQVRSALKAIHKYNFKRDMRDVANPCRIFALQDEGGVVICEWPDPATKPRVPLTYAEECMNGFEYQVAAHMVQAGLSDEGLEIVRAVRRRYDGERRNPWNEFECGNNYARSMASYSLLLAYSGFIFDLTQGLLGFAPVTMEFRGFWSLGGVWGEYEQSRSGATLRILHGSLGLNRLALPSFAGRTCTVSSANKALATEWEDDVLVLGRPLALEAGQSLEVVCFG